MNSACLNVRRMPQVNKAEYLPLLIHAPKHTQFPVEALTKGSEDCLARVFEGGRLGQYSESRHIPRPDAVLTAWSQPELFRMSLTIRT